MKYSPEQLIDRYIELRNQKAALAEIHADEMASLDKGMEAIEQAMNVWLADNGLRNAKSDETGAHCYFKGWFSAKVADPLVWFAWVLRQSNARDFLTNHVTKDTVIQHMNKNQGSPPPGITTDKGRKLIFEKG